MSKDDFYELLSNESYLRPLADRMYDSMVDVADGWTSSSFSFFELILNGRECQIDVKVTSDSIDFSDCPDNDLGRIDIE